MAGGFGAFAGDMQLNMGNVFGASCKKVDHITLPSKPPMWSGGLDVSGRFTCAGMPKSSLPICSTVVCCRCQQGRCVTAVVVHLVGYDNAVPAASSRSVVLLETVRTLTLIAINPTSAPDKYKLQYCCISPALSLFAACGGLDP